MKAGGMNRLPRTARQCIEWASIAVRLRHHIAFTLGSFLVLRSYSHLKQRWAKRWSGPCPIHHGAGDNFGGGNRPMVLPLRFVDVEATFWTSNTR